ncbi:hypothetical protein BDV59DRAFT_164323 [Aspergillus ambiguus]|uniref:uncharacterized protein n=1 Tax=Aspergillus ambiguus TaxID=176160 RepID=UPI003CCCE05C
MPRGAEYDDGVPHSDNAIEAGETKIHGANPDNAGLNRVNKVAELPDADFHTPGSVYGGLGSLGKPSSGSGKGGHEPHSLGEEKGTGAHKGTGFE